MRIYIVIPVHNEEAVLGKCLDSLINQSLLPEKLMLVDDNSTDDSGDIIQQYKKKYGWISSIKLRSGPDHLPGAKVINAFSKGLSQLDDNYDIICKFDADIVFPPNYLDQISDHFNRSPKLGICGGLLTVYKDGEWEYENIASRDHVRGPVKAYRKQCFEAIGGLKSSIGWDTIDVLLANYNGWDTKTIPDLYVKHLKPTGQTYSRSARLMQGQALYRMRYGLLISTIALAKSALIRKQFRFFINGLQGYWRSKTKRETFLVTEEEGRFIRAYRWKNILKQFAIRRNH